MDRVRVEHTQDHVEIAHGGHSGFGEAAPNRGVARIQPGERDQGPFDAGAIAAQIGQLSFEERPIHEGKERQSAFK